MQYEFDILMKLKGHDVLRLPPYHPELNPIELIWATMKNSVADRNTSFRLCDVEKLAREKFAAMGVADWVPICQRVIRVEETMMNQEHSLDANCDELRFSVNTGYSSSESEASDISD